ncbi:MAG: hypothetical protein VX549_03445 [Pseudomonadota bacterium]|nr:hypothetical protein [Pseudomonadota bacterium]
MGGRRGHEPLGVLGWCSAALSGAAKRGWQWWGVPLAHFGAGLVGLDERQTGSHG